MEGEHPQSICNGNQSGGEESNTSLINCKNKAEGNMEIIPQRSQPETSDEHQKLKLIVRSQYWGRELKGKTCRNVYTNMNVRAPLVITSQAVLYNTDGFWGCCPCQGKRVLELQEYHFSDACKGCCWDLYLVGTWVSPTQSIHDFFLLPQEQISVDIERNERLNGWSFFGTCNAGMIRSSINDILRDLLLQNDAHGHRYHHVHIDIMMDSAFDRETPRSRKLNNDKNRAERKKNIDSVSYCKEQQESSVTTDATASTEQESPPSASSKASNVYKSFATKVVGAAPPIPRLIANDPVPYVVPTPQPMANPAVGYQNAIWMGETNHWNHDQFSVPSRSCFFTSRPVRITNTNEHQGMYWHPAKAIPFLRDVSQQHSYWHHAHGAPFTTPISQPYYHVPDMQMNQYNQHQSMSQMGAQHTDHHYQTSEMRYCNMAYSENQHYTGIITSSENPFSVDPSTAHKVNTVENNIKFFTKPFQNASIKDNSVYPAPSTVFGPSPPDTPSVSPAPALVDMEEVSEVAKTNISSMISSGDTGGSSSQSSSIPLDNSVSGVPVDLTTSSSSTAELRCISAPSQLLISTVSES